MSANLSDYLENKWLDHILKNTAYSPAATLYFALFTSDPGESGVSGELTIGTGGYARAAVTNNTVNFPACAVSGTPTKSNGTVVQFPTASAAWGTITHWAVYDASSAGNMIVHGTMASSRYVAATDAPKVAVGAFSMTVSNSTAGGMTDYAKRKMLDHTFGAVTYTPASTIYLAVGTALTGESLTELDFAANTYARAAAVFGSASSGTSTNTSASQVSASLTGGPVTTTHFGIYDDATAGNLLIVGPLSTSRSAATGDVVTVPISGATCTFQ